MRKSQRKPVPEQHQTSDGGASCTEVHDETVPSREFQERPARTVGDLRKIYEPQETKRPQRKNEVCDQDGIICQPYMLFSSVDQNRNVPNQDILGNKIEPQERSEKTPVKSEDPQEKNGEQGRPALTVGALLKIYEPQKTKRPQRKNEKTPVKSVKGEQDKEKLQIKIDDLQKTVEYSLDKTEAISATMGDLLKKIDKGENDKYDSQKQIVDLLKKLEKTPKKDDDFQKKFEEMSATIGDLLKKIDKGEQERGILWEKIEKMKQEKDEIAQEKNQIAQEKEVLLHNLEKMKQEKDEIAQEKNEIAQEKEQLKKEIERKKDQFKSVWRDIPLYADWRKEEFQTVNLTLDAATAHPALFLSEEGRRITWQEPCQDLPISPERFASIPCVLGQLHASSGRYFWEVEVQNAHSWDLGVCRNYVERNGRVIMSPQNGFWAIRLYDGQYWGLTYPETSLTLKEKPCRVGVFLDCVAGDVSFYNMKDGSHIYTFSKQTFSGVIRPLFRLWSSDSGPLTIVQVE